ncbi:rho guanine nucleotide exchange factor 10 [Trichonephila inaurata madagascariensis]|uniref:Rho guanine nucleotide exchange factor 10 n=1 Tax=Trichonephila inaurata madagascariensis TaxID=2747483 RepID=A0A8X6XSN4_9ARAC|nr:rho guanine nucleotide exchange factor 10 [Trichonephila inaurata madagascariensis]
MACKVPYYYSELKKGAPVESEKNNLNKVENPYEKGRGFDNPLLAIEPDVSTCDIPEKVATFQKKKKKKKSFATPVYRRSNSLITNGLRMSPRTNYARKEVVSAGEGTANVIRKDSEQCHKRRSSEPNIYEEIPEQSHEDSSCYSGSVKGFVAMPRWPQTTRSRDGDRSSAYSSKVVLDEVEKVQQRHAQILENLNLDVEAMLMPEDTVCSEELCAEACKPTEHAATLEAKASHVLSPGTPPLYFASSRWQGGAGTLPKPATASLGRRVMNEYILQQSDFCPGGSKTTGGHGQKSAQRSNEPTCAGKSNEEPLYMLYDDTHRQQCSSRGIQTPEDNIYEEVDIHQINQTDEDFGDTVSFIDSEAGIDQSASSASEEVEEETGASKLAARFIGKKKKSTKKAKENEGITGGFTRWFSTRKKEYELEKCVSKINRHSQDEDGYVDVKIPKKQRPPLSLPPMPPGLSPEKMKRRYIIGSIVDSENSYVNSLQRLIRDYKHPLEDSTPPIVSANKISIMFHRVEQILQCHNIFGIALIQCVRQWDQEEKIGDVFVASFSKVMVSDIYSDFINNFSLAMETAKQASKNKSAFADFLKVKQINSSDRLSFFGLMVKPVQRFPQFILMLQDLLKETPPGHHDRMSLQMALTQLESLAETLNERKREAEQHHAVREVLKHLGKFSFKSSTDRDHFLLRQDDVIQLQLDQNGLVVKSKERRLFLLNDLLVSVAVTPRSNDGILNGERLNLKWAVALQDVEVHDDVAVSTKNLISSSRNKNFGSRSLERNSDGTSDKTLYDELRDLVHDKDIISRVEALVSSLRGSYPNLSVDIIQNISTTIQESVRQKCEEISLLDSCCLQLAVPVRSRSNKESICFQMSSPSVKRDWTTDLRLAKLALDPNNTPAWDIPEQEKRPSSKMPLFVKTFPVFQATCSAEVKCGCHYIVNSCSVPQQYMWLCSSDGVNSHLNVMAVHLTHLRQVAVYHLSETKIIAVEAVPGMQIEKGCPDPDSSNNGLNSVLTVETVWMGTESRKVLILEGSCPEKWEEIGSTIVPASIIQLKYHWDQVYCALSNGSVIIFHRDGDGQWQLQDPTVVTLDQDPVTCLLPLGLTMYCASGSKVWVVDSITAEVQRSYSIQHDNEGQAYLLAHSGTGLWIALKNSATICLYHTETFRHLQDINIAANVNRILAGKDKDKSPHTIYVTSLVACKGLLWVGTNVGILLTVPLPRLEGVPIITGRVSLAFHAHQGPVQLLLSLQPKALSIPVLASPVARRPASADGDEESLVSPRTRVIKQISDSVLPSSVSNKKLTGPKTNLSDIHASGAKTLPRGMSLCPHISPQGNIEESNDVYGLYADLMNVQDYEKDSQEKLYERLNHSDPELVHFHLNTLDRRVQQKSGRPRSWDLSTMAVSEDSDSSAAYDTASTVTSTATTEISMPSPESTCDEVHSPVQKISDESRSLPTHVTLGRTVYKSAPKTVTDSTQKTVLMLTGGCGYTNWRKLEKDHDSKSSLDAHVMIWEVKL